MQSCAVALGKHNIRCNALLPGTIKTQLNDKDLEDDEKRKYMESRTPLGRTGVTTDMVGPAVFLASQELSGYVVSIGSGTSERLEGNDMLTCFIDWGTVVGRWRTVCQSAVSLAFRGRPPLNSRAGMQTWIHMPGRCRLHR